MHQTMSGHIIRAMHKIIYKKQIKKQKENKLSQK